MLHSNEHLTPTCSQKPAKHGPGFVWSRINVFCLSSCQTDRCSSHTSMAIFSETNSFLRIPHYIFSLFKCPSNELSLDITIIHRVKQFQRQTVAVLLSPQLLF